jgi:hypothetical protein
MNPDFSLLIAGLIAEFLLRSTLAFVICLILNRLATKASTRFAIWAGYLYASAAYWLYLAGTLVPRRPVAGVVITLPQSSQAARSWAAALASWKIPQSWGF